MDSKRYYTKTLLGLLYIVVFSVVLSLILIELIRGNAGLQNLLAFIFPTNTIVAVPYQLIGILAIILGFILVFWANYMLLIVGKIGLRDREPFHIPSTLIVDGPYKFSRNPIYTGVCSLVFGLSFLIGSVPLFILAIVLMAIFWRFLIRWEERKLEETFGEKYMEYKRRVRRWL
ncbi:MAG: methyltransferase family protein [Candidatus Hodarchaeales archaeon]|jgi:protein-S-isoprenylcysteine O-methyltransferase Ste14